MCSASSIAHPRAAFKAGSSLSRRETASPLYRQDLERIDPRAFKLVSTDVFDTLLLRSTVAERTRLWAAERQFETLLAERGWTVSAHDLLQARRAAQATAFRALNTGTRGEVRLTDIVSRQLRLLGLPASLMAERVRIEIDVEKNNLRPNIHLARHLRRFKAAGVRVVAVSDTTLSGQDLESLISHVHGGGLIDKVYSSADEGATKRRGNLFATVVRTEGVQPCDVLHLGDDAHADVRMAAAHGITSVHLTRPQAHTFATRANGGLTQARISASRHVKMRGAPHPLLVTPHNFAHHVLGPITVQFCQMIWLYAQQAQSTDDCVLLFCARGGIGIRQAFERVAETCGLPLNLPRRNLLVSRLIAARAAIVMRSDAALQELRREFEHSSFTQVANALGGKTYDLGPAWNRTFDAAEFYDLLSSKEGAGVCRDIETQNELFKRHLADATGTAQRIILCDTGLYGSTQRLLSAGFPHLRIETIQFARANYKGHSEEHFPKVAGLLVERDQYSPLISPSCVLRYWHLIESLFEPAIPSVKLLHAGPDGCVSANSGPIELGDIDAASANVLLAGVLDYIHALPPSLAGLKASNDAAFAWARLKQAITWPSRNDLACLTVKERSVDFGRQGTVNVMETSGKKGPSARLRAVKSALWREGAIVREFAHLRPLLLTALECSHTLRPALAKARRWTS